VDLLTLEVHSYGEESLVGSKIVEHVAPAAAAAVAGPQPAAVAAVIGSAVRPGLPPVQPASQLPVVTLNTFIQPS